jgi:hypothetical protein
MPTLPAGARADVISSGDWHYIQVLAGQSMIFPPLVYRLSNPVALG